MGLRGDQRGDRPGLLRRNREGRLKLLLDTNALIWAFDPDERLGPNALDAIRAPDNDVVVSVVAAWEVAIKRAAGKLRIADDFATRATEEGYRWLGVSLEHALRAGGLPLHHRDPFDRMMVAQAQLERLTIVTADSALERYDVDLLSARS